MVTEYLRLQPYELAELHRLLTEDPDQAYEYAGDLQFDDTRGLDVDRSGAALSFLLAMAGAPVDVVMGGTPLTAQPWAADPPRLFGPDQVAQAAGYLSATPFDVLVGHFDPDELVEAQVPPTAMWHDYWALSYLGDHYARLTTLFQAAADACEPILTWHD